MKKNSIFKLIEFSDSNYFIPADEYLVQFAKKRNAILKKSIDRRRVEAKNIPKINLTNRST